MHVYRILCLCVIFLAGCQSNWAPVADIQSGGAKLSGEHIVQPGETLYAIGWRYNRDFKELAQANNIPPPYRIYVGQKISLQAKPKVAQTQAITSEAQVSAKAPTSAPAKAQTVASKAVAPLPVTKAPATQSAAGQWQWPVKGKIIGQFSQTKGIDIAGVEGEIVHAAGEGRVVYSGTGLRGYGQLLIIKHNEKFLSAYAHNKHLLVKENDWVKIGQPIAEMGNTDTNRVKLHFEIRQDGKPVDPLRYLPKQ